MVESKVLSAKERQAYSEERQNRWYGPKSRRVVSASTIAAVERPNRMMTFEGGELSMSDSKELEAIKRFYMEGCFRRPADSTEKVRTNIYEDLEAEAVRNQLNTLMVCVSLVEDFHQVTGEGEQGIRFDIPDKLRQLIL